MIEWLHLQKLLLQRDQATQSQPESQPESSWDMAYEALDMQMLPRERLGTAYQWLHLESMTAHWHTPVSDLQKNRKEDN